MIKIDWHKWFHERVIFGFYHYKVYIAEFDLVNPPAHAGKKRKTAKMIWITRWEWNWADSAAINKNCMPWHRCFLRNAIG